MTELGHSIEYFLGQYEESIQFLAESTIIKEYAVELGERSESNINSVEKELDNYFKGYVDIFCRVILHIFIITKQTYQNSTYGRFDGARSLDKTVV